VYGWWGGEGDVGVGALTGWAESQRTSYFDSALSSNLSGSLSSPIDICQSTSTICHPVLYFPNIFCLGLLTAIRQPSLSLHYRLLIRSIPIKGIYRPNRPKRTHAPEEGLYNETDLSRKAPLNEVRQEPSKH
jgi:hypothetical protein